MLLHEKADYDAFERMLGEGLEHYRIKLLGYQFMSNHFCSKKRDQTSLMMIPLHALSSLGDFSVSLEEMFDVISLWHQQGGRNTWQPTHFDFVDGRF